MIRLNLPQFFLADLKGHEKISLESMFFSTLLETQIHFAIFFFRETNKIVSIRIYGSKL